jgi:membrane-bound ClpP family serine protease
MMTQAFVLLLAAASDPAPTEAMSPSQRLFLAVGLMGLAALLLAVEFFVVSWGLLAIGSLAAAVAAIVVAFSVSAAAGWALVVATPVLAWLIIRWGLARLQGSSLVPQAEITADAGYRHLAEQLGIAVGAVGELITDAMPTGRARFAKGEIDVAVRGTTLPRGHRVVVQAISGAIILVVAAPAAEPPPSPSPNANP